jgi:hypothetical protein
MIKNDGRHPPIPALLILLVFVALFLINPSITYIALQGFWIGATATAFVLICEEIRQ